MFTTVPVFQTILSDIWTILSSFSPVTYKFIKFPQSFLSASFLYLPPLSSFMKFPFLFFPSLASMLDLFLKMIDLLLKYWISFFSRVSTLYSCFPYMFCNLSYAGFLHVFIPLFYGLLVCLSDHAWIYPRRKFKKFAPILIVQITDTGQDTHALSCGGATSALYILPLPTQPLQQDRYM